METSLLKIRIALAFPIERHSEISEFISLLNEFQEVTLKTVSSYDELVLFNPTIVVTNQYNWSLEYCKSHLNVKWVHLMSSGVDNAISSLRLRKDSLVITNIKGIHKEIMSNYILGWILSESINLHKYFNNQKIKKWERYRSSTISGKNALIFGYGNIGSAIAKSLSCFGIKSIGVNTSKEMRVINDSIITIPFTDIYNYLNGIDYIIISAPLTKVNYKFIDDKFFCKLNSSPILINISRAEIIDSKSLINAIKNRQINKAILDVHYSEPLDFDSEYWGYENIYITPHISGYFNEGMEMGFLKFKELLLEYLHGEINLINRVSFTNGY